MCQALWGTEGSAAPSGGVTRPPFYFKTRHIQNDSSDHGKHTTQQRQLQN